MTPADLAAEHVGLVHAIARGQRRRIGGDYDELVGDGMVGLVQAAQRFDPSGAPFTAYARTRIIGEMIEGYRRRYYRGSQGQGGFRDEVSLEEDWAFEHRFAPSAEDDALARLGLADLLERVAALPGPLRVTVETACADGVRAGTAGRGDGRFAILAAREGVHPSRISQRLAEARRRLAA